MLCQQATYSWPQTDSFAIRTNVNLYNLHSRFNQSHSLTRFNLSPRLPAFSAYSWFAEQVSLWCLRELCGALPAHSLCSACSFPSPLGGRGVAFPPQKKNQVGSDASALLDPDDLLCASISVSRRALIPSLISYYSIDVPLQKKKRGGRKDYTRKRWCYAASSSATAVPVATSCRCSTCWSSCAEDCCECFR